MPELPEVETMRRGILGLAGNTITDMATVKNPCKPLQINPTLATLRRKTLGAKIDAVERWGKRVVLRLSTSDVLIFEPRMTGLVLLTDPPDSDHLRFRIRFQSAPRELLYWDRRGLGRISLLSRDRFQQDVVKLGPDALQLSHELLCERLSDLRRPIKVALLDQKRIAGIGNLYASEILYLARISPLRNCHRIRDFEWQRLCEAVKTILEEAIRCEGSTLSDGTYRNALNNPGSYQNHHRVYDRAGQLCSTCKVDIIRRVVQSQRSTFYCRKCQK